MTVFLSCKWLVAAATLRAAGSLSDFTRCTQRWRQEDALSQLYLKLTTWERDGQEDSHNFYDVTSTFMLLARGASFARLPSEHEDTQMPPWLSARVSDAMRVVGGYPERCGICVAAMNAVSKDAEVHFRLGTQAREASKSAQTASHVQQRLPPGKYCHSLALDRRPWDNLQVSSFEIQEHFARDVVFGRNVLILRGADQGPDDSQLAQPMRFARKVAVIPFQSGLDSQSLDAFLSELGVLLAQSASDLLVLTGLTTGLAALIAMEVTCSYGVQTLDVGPLALTSTDLGPKPSSLITNFRPQGSETPESTDVRPHFRHHDAGFLDLNGRWQILITSDDVTFSSLPPWSWDQLIEVPFAPQSHKGLAMKISPSEAVWYRRRVLLPEDWCNDAAGVVELHIDACDWECAVFLNGALVGVHRGAYDPFAFKLDQATAAACYQDGAELTIRAWDPTDEGCTFSDNPPIPCDSCCETGWQPRGKQALKPGSIMYTGVTGLWRQGAWLERLPSCHISQVDLSVNPEGSQISVQVAASCHQNLNVEIHSLTDALVLGRASGPCCTLTVTTTERLQPWSPESVKLYKAVITLGRSLDAVSRRFAHRTLAVQAGQIVLNGKPIFMHGVLYQGYWPESLLTPPFSGAIENDLRALKEAGFNTVRVHAVVMGARFYSLCDELGLMVWQDMPSGDMRALPTWSENRGVAEDITFQGRGVSRGAFDEIRRSPDSQAAFQRELEAMVAWLKPFPSIVSWVLFNEGWGQSNTAETVTRIRKMDATRLVDAASGWNEIAAQPLGDFADVHNYEDNSSAFGPLPDSFRGLERLGFQVLDRVRVLGEYGGLGYAIEGHEWTQHGAWSYGDKKVNRNGQVFEHNLMKLLERLLTLSCNRLGGAIYTQWNDVETEMNGLLTYDRHFKLPLEVLRTFSSSIFRTWLNCSRQET